MEVRLACPNTPLTPRARPSPPCTSRPSRVQRVGEALEEERHQQVPKPHLDRITCRLAA